MTVRAGRWNGREVVQSRAPVEVLPPLELVGRKLNLGAGWDRTEGYIRVDRAGDPDIKLDVNHLPFADDSFVEIRAFHILEHLERRDLVPLMNECWRILQPEGVMEIEVPLFPTEAAVADPTHISFFVAATFDYFTKDGQFDGQRMLYGIKPWALTDRVRDAMAIFLRVRLHKLTPDDTQIPLSAPVDVNVEAGLGEPGTTFAPGAGPVEVRYHICCGAPIDGPHLGTCNPSLGNGTLR